MANRGSTEGKRRHCVIEASRGTFEDPDLGAHSAFLDEIVDLADTVHYFPGDVQAPELLAWYATH